MTGWVLGRTYSFRGQAVRYAVLGEGSPIVLAHGTPFSSYVWHRIAPYLAERRQVFVFDLLGRAAEPGDEVQADGVRFTVLEVEGSRIQRLEVEFLPVASAAEDGPEQATA